jgi:low temperature requirement protein LtrA
MLHRMTEPQRRADWFELFFDLVFVVTVAVLAHGLHGDPGWSQYATFLFLFFPAWWAWVNLMVSVNLFGARWTRSMLLLAMPGLGLMAAAAPDGLGSRAWAYALGAAWVRLILFAIWWTRTRGSGVPAWRPSVYSIVTTVMFVVSALLPSPYIFILWYLAIALEVGLLTWRRGLPDIYGRFAAEHLVERIGLFLVIVLGESVFGIVTAYADHFAGPSAIAALGGLVTAAMLAIGFFHWGAAVAEHGILSAQSRVQTGQSQTAREIMREAVLYLPFILVSAITIVAAALTEAVAEPTHHLPAGHRYGLAVGLAAYYLTNGLITWRLGGAGILRWLVPQVVLALVVVLPVAAVAPAWLAVTVAAVVCGLIVLIGKYNDRRLAAASS